MAWLQLTLEAPREAVEQVEDALLEAGAVSVTLADAHDVPVLEPLPGETPLWPDARITGLFEADTDPDAVRALLATRLSTSLLTSLRDEIVADQDWERAWMDSFQPMRFGERLWIVPSWHEPPEPEHVNLLLDPGLAFGTGNHATTALCLSWLDGEPLAGKTVLDFGCGSGILAIAALKLGAREAWAVDIDPQAVTATADNAQRNGIDPGRLHIGLPSLLSPELRADVVIANILANPLIELAGQLALHVAPGGRIALSGILIEQADAVRQAYLDQGIDMAPPVVRDDWVRLEGQRPA